MFPKDADGKMQFSDVDYLDTWKALEESVTTKLVRSIGVSNFNEEQMERVMAEAKVPICVNQVSLVQRSPVYRPHQLRDVHLPQFYGTHSRMLYIPEDLE